MTEWLTQHAPARSIGLALVQFLWQGGVIGVATAGALALLRRASASIRYVVACLALLAMLAAPVATVIRLNRVPQTGVVTNALVYAVPSGGRLRSAPISTRAAAQPTPAASAWVQSVETWLPVILVVWCLGVAALTLRLLSDWLAVESLKRSAVAAVPDVWVTRMHAIGRRVGVTRTLRMAESAAVRVPTVIGWLRPLVLMPVSTMAGLSPFQFDAILAHELAHIRRHDYLINVLQHVVETLLFYHPAVWWLSSRVRVEREHCCDDIAVSLCGDRVAYAGALASLEDLRGRSVALALPATGGVLLNRVRRLIAPPQADRYSSAWALAAMGLALITIPMMASVEGRADLRRTAQAAGSLAKAAPSRVSALATDVGTLAFSSTTLQPAPEGTVTPKIGPARMAPPASEALWSTAIDRFLLGGIRGNGAGTPDPIVAREMEWRSAVNANNINMLAQMLDTGFTGTDAQGVTRNKADELRRLAATPVRLLSGGVVSGLTTGGTAFTGGSQIEAGVVTTRTGFTHMWTSTPSGWMLVRSSHVDLDAPRSFTLSSAAQAQRDLSDLLYAAAQEAAENRVRTSGSVPAPRVILQTAPAYPAAARAQGLSGDVGLELSVDRAGVVTDARVVKPLHSLLDQSAIDAVLQWQYEPTRVDGVAVPVTMPVTISFGLASKPQPAVPRAPAASTSRLGNIALRVASPQGAGVSAPPAAPVNVGGTIQEPKVLRKVQPAYPAAARAAGVQGYVILEATIDPAGLVANTRVIRSSSSDLLDEAAASAVSQWRYTPTLLNNVAVSVLLNVTINFSMPPSPQTAAAPAPGADVATVAPQGAAPAAFAPIRVGGAIQEPKILSKVAPVYPAAARAAGAQGYVILEATIGTDGGIADARVLKSTGNEELDQAALDAVSQWRYTPTLLNNRPVAILLSVTVNFSLKPAQPAATTTGAAAAGGLTAARNAVTSTPDQNGTSSGTPTRIGGGIPEPKLLKRVQPVYPAAARAAGIQGYVVLEITLDRDGSVVNIRVTKSVPELDQAAINAVSQWKYTPTLLNGVATPVLMSVTVAFRLN